MYIDKLTDNQIPLVNLSSFCFLQSRLTSIKWLSEISTVFITAAFFSGTKGNLERFKTALLTAGSSPGVCKSDTVHQ